MNRGQFNKKHPNHFDFGASKRKPFGVSSFLRLVRQYKANAKRRNLEFSLSNEIVKKLSQGNCAYCGVKPKQIMVSKDSFGYYTYNGIDRCNKNKGYIVSNCITCCKICNRAKSNMTIREWNNYLYRLIKYNTVKTIKDDEKPKGEK